MGACSVSDGEIEVPQSAMAQSFLLSVLRPLLVDDAHCPVDLTQDAFDCLWEVFDVIHDFSFPIKISRSLSVEPFVSKARDMHCKDSFVVIHDSSFI